MIVLCASASAAPAWPAIEEDLRQFQQAFNGEVAWLSSSPTFWLVLGVVAGLILASAAAVRFVRHDHARHGPANRRVLASFGLARADRRLVRQLTRRAGLTQPAAILISEGCFDFAAGRWGEAGGRVGDIARLRARVFGA